MAIPLSAYEIGQRAVSPPSPGFLHLVRSVVTLPNLLLVFSVLVSSHRQWKIWEFGVITTPSPQKGQSDDRRARKASRLDSRA
jgi:hypothetical protein